MRMRNASTMCIAAGSFSARTRRKVPYDTISDARATVCSLGLEADPPAPLLAKHDSEALSTA